MASRDRPGYTNRQRSELWRRWKLGESLSDIGRALGKHPSSVFGVVQRRGGFAPEERKRAESALSLAEREEISRGIAAGLSLRQIASELGRAPSTLSRELARNGGREGYRAAKADERAWQTTRRPKTCKLARNRKLQRVVAAKLQSDWSPEQIAGWLRRVYRDDRSMQISHETLYRSLFVQARGVLREELLKHLRSGRLMRHAAHATTAGQSRGQINGAVSIRERPASIEDRAVPGHWEGDLLCGSSNTYIATLVERQSRFTLLVKVDSKDATTVATALIHQIKRLPAELRRSLTWDRGTELSKHKQITLATDIDIYFCDPQSPWQRGTNENTNRLLRQYFPRKTDLAVYSQADLNRVARLLNGRPRKTLGFISPADKFNQSVAMTG